MSYRRLRAFLAPAPLVLSHLMPLFALFTGTQRRDWIVCIVLYFVRMFGVAGGYHRYFSHRTYKTSRVFRFFMAFLAQTSAQRGVLWWASHHRAHHKYSDQEQDPHNSRRGFWHSHVGWLYQSDTKTDFDAIKDLTKYRELVWLDRHWLVPPIMLAVALLVLGGPSMLWIGFFGSTVLLWHGTFSINSLAHIWGTRRYQTTDDSRNNFLLALLTTGEGWHNNHHHFQHSTRQGFHWWQIDLTYYVLRLLSFFHIVWKIVPPREIAIRQIQKA